MGFLAPLFLLGVLAVTLPIWLHRLQTQSSDRQPFSSAMLLETTEQRVHVRKQLKYLVLLAMRVALLMLLASAFAKPFLSSAPSTLTDKASGTHLILVDTSVSMSRSGVFAQALAEAGRAIDEAPNDASIQVLSADSALHLKSEPADDRSNHRAALSGLEVSALRLDFGEMMTAIDRLAGSLPPPVSLHIISDFQSSAMPVRFSDLIPSRIAELIPHIVSTGEPINWSAEYLRETADGLDAGLSGYGDRERIANVDVLLNDVVIDSRALNETGPQIIRLTVPDYEEGDNRVTLKISTDDDFQADNEWFHVVEKKPPTPVPLITLHTAGLPVTYLSAALESATGNGYQVQLFVPGEFDSRVLSRYRWAIVDDIGLIDAELSDALTDFLQNGGSLLAFAGERAADLETIPVSGHRYGPTSVGTGVNQFLSIGQIDAGHPVLSQTEGWHTVNVSRSLPVDVLDGDQVIIRLENNEPFLIERRIGEGRLLLVLGSLDNRWNDLPVRPVFVSFMIETARYLSGINDIPKTYTTGATLPLALVGSASGQIVDPDGNTILSLADTTREQQIELTKTGFYEVYTSQGETLIAANIDPLESDLRTMSQEVLDRWRDATHGRGFAGDSQASEQAAETVELWHWALLLLALVIIAESVLANAQLTPRRMVQV